VPKRPDVSSRASTAAMRGVAAYDPPAPEAADGGGEAAAAPARRPTFEQLHQRRTLYVETELLQALDARRAATGEKLATMVNDALRAYLGK
jgi:uncharacterized protein (DUF4415 family)